MRKNSIKYSRMNGEVQRELSKIISRDIKDPRIHPMTSVVSVDVTPDLKFAKVFVSVLGNDEDKEKTKKGLASAASHIRSLLIFIISKNTHKNLCKFQIRCHIH